MCETLVYVGQGTGPPGYTIYHDQFAPLFNAVLHMRVQYQSCKKDSIMIKKSLTAFLIIFCSINVIAENNVADCIFSGEISALNSDKLVNLCSTNYEPKTRISAVPNVSNNDVITLFHVKQKKSSLAESITVVLFIPGLILLLFSRFTKSAK